MIGRLPALVIFARAPSPGRVKTHLIPLLGASGAAAFQEALLADTVRKALALGDGVAAYLFLAGAAPRSLFLPPRLRVLRQHGSDLGKRLEDAFQRVLRRHPGAVVIGTDSPTLPPRLLWQAIKELRFCEAVLGPCPDGGYYLVGLRHLPRRIRGIFRRVRWGTPSAFRDTLRNLAQRSFSCSILEPWVDVDRPEDIGRLKSQLARAPRVRRLAPATWRFLRRGPKPFAGV